MLQSNPILAISEHNRCGLILSSAHHAVFAGPGAAIGIPAELGFEDVVIIGEPHLTLITQHSERQRAYNSRIQWMRWLQRIASHPDAGQRTEKLLSSFEAFFGPRIVACLPNPVLARMVGVLPKTIQAVREQSPTPLAEVSSQPGQLVWQQPFAAWLYDQTSLAILDSQASGTLERLKVKPNVQDQALVRAS